MNEEESSSEYEIAHPNDLDGFQNIFLDFLLTYSLEIIGLADIISKELISSDEEGNFYKIMKKGSKEIYGLHTKNGIKIDNPKNTLSFVKQFNTIIKLNSPLILDIIGYNTKDFTIKNTPVFLTEYPQKGTLKSVIKSTTETLNNTQKLINLYGIAAGIEYLHSHDIYNCNIQPNNIFLDENFHPKIGCFDILNVNFNKASKKMTKFVYMAPEILNNGEITKKSDVYSFAMIIYEVVTLTILSDQQSQIMKGKRPSLDEHKIPKCYKNLIRKCWSEEPSKRPTFKEILASFENDEEFLENVEMETFFDYVDSINDSLNKGKLKIKKFNKHCINIPPLNIKKFAVMERIGKSAYANVFQIKERKTGRIYCAKQIEENLKDIDEDLKIDLSREINLMLKMNFPTIAKFIGYSLIDFEDELHIVIVFEYASNGSLDNVLKSIQKGLYDDNWNITKEIINLYGIAKGMAYLHSINIVHCNLKPSNILLDDDFNPKIVDFALSQMASDSHKLEVQLSRIKGTPLYMPPEVINDVEWSKSGDVYSFSILMYEVLTGQNPFPKIGNSFQLMSSIMSGKRPVLDHSIPQYFEDLLERCWSEDQSKRPTFDEIATSIKENMDLFEIDLEEVFYYIEELDNWKDEDAERYKSFELGWEEDDDEEKEEIKSLLVNIKPISLKLFKNNKEKIGNGQFGNVYKVLEKKTGIIYAAKVWILDLISCSDNNVEDISREINIIAKLNYKSVLKFKGFNSGDFKSRPRPTIITEYIKNGSLQQCIDEEQKGKAYPNWDDTKKLINIYGIASGMKYLHSKNILHRDLKPDNIFLNDCLYPKIGDFGLSKEITNDPNNDNSKGSGYKGTRMFSAPEILNENKYLKAGDVYAFAMIVYEVMTLSVPFEGFVSILFQYNVIKGLRPKIGSDVLPCYKQLIEKCWDGDPDKRPTFEQIVEELKTNGDYITDTVDEDEFLNYIESLGDSIPSSKTQTPTKTKRTKKEPKKVTIDLKLIEDTEKIQEEEKIKEVNETFNNKIFINLNNFEKIKRIKIGNNSKIYKVRGKKTNIFYIAKASTILINKQTRDELIHLSREVNIISQLNHPSFLQLIGYSPNDFKQEQKPVVIYELPKNGSLFNIIKKQREDKSIQGWDETMKLINIYGIAAGMAYLHSQDIIHRNLTTKSVFLDKFLFPKIGNFGFVTRIHTNETITFQSISRNKQDLEYMSPELLQYNEFSKASDIYAFAIIVFEIMTLQIPFGESKISMNVFNDVAVKSKRPIFKVKIPDCYRKLIEVCWSQDPTDRPSFENIEYILKTNEEFMAKVDKDVFRNYVKKIEESKVQFYTEKKFFSLDGLIKEKSRVVEEKSCSSESESESESDEKVKKPKVKQKNHQINDIKDEKVDEKSTNKNKSNCCLLL